MRTASLLVGAALAIASAGCTASSRVADAVVTEVDGAPCFTVPNNDETRAGVPLFGVSVTKSNGPGATARPEEVWNSFFEPMGKSAQLKPQNCIRYGVSPPSARHDVLIALLPYVVYKVVLNAVPEGSNLRGYSAEFCVIPTVGKKPRVQVVLWDAKASRWRYELCATGAK